MAHSHPLPKPLRQRFLQLLTQPSTLAQGGTSGPSLQHTLVPRTAAGSPQATDRGATQPLRVTLK